MLIGDVKRADRRYPAYFGLRPLVRTSVLPADLGWPAGGEGGWQRGPAPVPGPVPVIDAQNRRSVTVRRIGIWLMASLAGLALGLAATSSVIGALR